MQKDRVPTLGLICLPKELEKVGKVQLNPLVLNNPYTVRISSSRGLYKDSSLTHRYTPDHARQGQIKLPGLSYTTRKPVECLRTPGRFFFHEDLSDGGKEGGSPIALSTAMSSISSESPSPMSRLGELLEIHRKQTGSDLSILQDVAVKMRRSIS